MRLNLEHLPIFEGFVLSDEGITSDLSLRGYSLRGSFLLAIVNTRIDYLSDKSNIGYEVSIGQCFSSVSWLWIT